MKTLPSLAIGSAFLAAAACAGMQQREPLTTVALVDLSRYAGTWYEIARLPMWFQRHCVDSKAIYTSRPDGTVGVHNECETDAGGLDQVDGVATVVDQKTNARLSVVFDNFFARFFGSSRQGNYWILDLVRTIALRWWPLPIAGIFGFCLARPALTNPPMSIWSQRLQG